MGTLHKSLLYNYYVTFVIFTLGFSMVPHLWCQSLYCLWCGFDDDFIFEILMP